MPDRRNPYFILGVDHGASLQQAQAAFARLSRRLRQEAGASYRIEDATWALHQIEHAAVDPSADLGVYRVPANPDAYAYPPASGILSLAPQNLPRRTGSSEQDVAGLRAEVAEQLASTALSAAVETWERPVPVVRQPDQVGVQPAGAAGAAGSPEPATAAEPAAVPGSPAVAGSARRHDPFAVALGNASLLGVGYLLLRRWGAAFGALLTTAVLVLILTGFGQPGWFWRVALTLWWIVTITHGWRLARRQATPPVPAVSSAAGPPVGPPAIPVAGGSGKAWGIWAGGGGWERYWRQRSIAVAAGLVVLSFVLSSAVDARRIESAAADAHQAGDCEEAAATLDRVGARHRVVDPFVNRRSANSTEACGLLLEALARGDDEPLSAADTLAQYVDHPYGLWPGAPELRADLLLVGAEEELATALEGDLASLESGFGTLTEVLEVAPGRVDEVNDTLDGYLAQLPDVDSCDAMSNADWLTTRGASGNELDRASEDADRLAPSIMLACGDQLLKPDPPGARDVYQELLDRYPDHELAKAARKGIDKAETRVEAEKVRKLLSGPADGPPRYCDAPAPYRGAPPYEGGGPHLLLPLGAGDFRKGVPSEWRAEDHTDAVLVLCVEGPEYGSVLRTCDYQSSEGVFSVNLHANEYEVRAYELHTGDRAFKSTVEAGGGDCPPALTYYQGQRPNRLLAGHGNAPIRSAVQPWVFP